jgi:nicotinate-nucleotide pyrophosphorylase (carboxylating)
MYTGMMLDEIIERGLKEDIHYIDVTTAHLIDEKARSKAKFLFKEDGVLCGVGIIERVFNKLCPGDFSVECYHKDGDSLEKGTIFAEIEGPTQSLLMGERLTLNLMQRMSGVATLSKAYHDQVSDLGTMIVDTRKTSPGLRVIEKYAVQVGGCRNHRYNLSEGVMIKDNHIQASGGISLAVSKIRSKIGHTMKIEVEVSNFDQLDEALASGAEIIMLDNMSLEMMTEAVRRIDKKAISEASGGITLETVRKVAETGVMVISSGELTHSYRSHDISMKFY